MEKILRELQQWCVQRLDLPPTAVANDLEMVSGDASFRQYYRLHLLGGGSYIAVHAPPDKEDNQAFSRVQEIMHAGGVKVPALLAWDEPRGFLLQEDFGNQTLLPLLTNAEVADRYYRKAMTMLVTMQSIPVADGLLPHYDATRLQTEMALFPNWFVTELLGYTLESEDEAMLSATFDALCQRSLAQEQLLVHRDFHSRNLMCLADDSLGAIDFQDAVVGAPTYDLVSLLRDCYVAWPQEQIRSWALAYRDQAVAAGVIARRADDEFLRDFDLMGLQRHIKVLGIFARLWLRDGKQSYLADLPLVIAYTLSMARQYPEFSAFVLWFEEKLLPLAEQQNWYREVQL